MQVFILAPQEKMKKVVLAILSQSEKYEVYLSLYQQRQYKLDTKIVRNIANIIFLVVL